MSGDVERCGRGGRRQEGKGRKSSLGTVARESSSLAGGDRPGRGSGGSFYRPPLHVRPFPFRLLGAAPRPLSCQSPKRVASTRRFSTPESYTPPSTAPQSCAKLAANLPLLLPGTSKKASFLTGPRDRPLPSPFLSGVSGGSGPLCLALSRTGSQGVPGA